MFKFWKSESGRCENEAVVRNFLQILQVQTVKMKPELAVPMRDRSNHDPSIAGTVSHPSTGQASPHKHLPRHVLSCKTQHFVHLLSPKNAFRARHPSKSESERYESEAVVRDSPQKVKVEDVRTKLSWETSLKKSKWKMWGRNCRARLPSKSESGRCGNEAVVRDFLQRV